MTAGSILVELARRDARLYGLRQQITNFPRRIQELSAQRSKLELQLREAEGRLQQSESARRKLEGELTEYRQRKAKSESRLASLTSTEQYQALVKEIAGHAARIDELESQILEAMDRSEQVQRQVDAERVRVQQAVGVIEEQQHALQVDLEAAKVNLPEESRARDAFLSQVDAPTRTLYDRILRAKGDAALALVTGQSCGICKAVQPPQVLQVLRQGEGLTRTCQMCGRILVWDGAST